MEQPILSAKSIAYGILRALGIIGGILILFWFLWSIQSVILYIGIAAVLSLIGRPLVILLRDRLKFPNILAVIITLFIILILLMSVTYMIIPVIVEQGENLGRIDWDEVGANLEVLNVQVSEFFGIENVNLFDRMQSLDYIKNFNVKTYYLAIS